MVERVWPFRFELFVVNLMYGLKISGPNMGNQKQTGSLNEKKDKNISSWFMESRYIKNAIRPIGGWVEDGVGPSSVMNYRRCSKLCL